MESLHRHKIPLEVVQGRIKRNTLILIGVMFYAYLSNFFFTQFENKMRHHPFPLHGVHRDGTITNQDIYDPAYADYAAKALAWAVFLFALCYILPEYREILFIGSLLFFGYTIEFGVIYNDPVSWIHFVWQRFDIDIAILPVGFSTFAGLSLIAMFLYKYFEK